jgi:hypothetical protein
MNSLCGTEGILINLKIYYFAEVAVESMKGESAKQRNPTRLIDATKTPPGRLRSFPSALGMFGWGC